MLAVSPGTAVSCCDDAPYDAAAQTLIPGNARPVQAKPGPHPHAGLQGAPRVPGRSASAGHSAPGTKRVKFIASVTAGSLSESTCQRNCKTFRLHTRLRCQHSHHGATVAEWHVVSKYSHRRRWCRQNSRRSRSPNTRIRGSMIVRDRSAGNKHLSKLHDSHSKVVRGDHCQCIMPWISATS
jgi:hypothetical protein